MFGSRRLAKRSIVGTRVSALGEDGRFYPGFITATDSSSETNAKTTTYEIRFDNGSSRQNVFRKEIVAPGFQSITALQHRPLKPGQKLFVTHNGREISGELIKHDAIADELTIVHKNSTGLATGDEAEETEEDAEKMFVTRKLDECRLIESRKSARLQDHGDSTDYSKLLEMHPEPKKRNVSSVIDVPAKSRRRCHSPDDYQLKLERCVGEEEVEDVMEIMDERMAAMVLTSLSCSPVSPKFPTSFNDQTGSNRSPPRAASWNERHLPATANISPSWKDSYLSTSAASSGIISNQSDESTDPNHSPPQLPSSTTPTTAVAPPLFGSYQDEGIEVDDGFFSGEHARKRRKSSSMKTVYQCTWPGCMITLNTEQLIEKHVRNTHLGPRQQHSSDSDLSDHEEEFYYAEVEVEENEALPMATTASLLHRSIVTRQPPMAIHDHDYQKKERPIFFHNTRPDTSGAISIPIPHVKRSLSWQPHHGSSGAMSMSPPTRLAKFVPQFLSSSTPTKTAILISPPRNSPLHKRSRSDVKKCRKIYGMDNRDMWCTQCKWKKACTRFTE
ncbi:zinc finger protein 395-like [Tubulanus polymorphus]|uniref:zinc finger protein 395-like n=1 Tax=Tubulanus polymorphus TaxID=672921 RepID=UPI003DA54E6C